MGHIFVYLIQNFTSHLLAAIITLYILKYLLEYYNGFRVSAPPSRNVSATGRLCSNKYAPLKRTESDRYIKRRSSHTLESDCSENSIRYENEIFKQAFILSQEGYLQPVVETDQEIQVPSYYKTKLDRNGKYISESIMDITSSKLMEHKLQTESYYMRADRSTSDLHVTETRTQPENKTYAEALSDQCPNTTTIYIDIKRPCSKTSRDAVFAHKDPGVEISYHSKDRLTCKEIETGKIHRESLPVPEKPEVEKNSSYGDHEDQSIRDEGEGDNLSIYGDPEDPSFAEEPEVDNHSIHKKPQDDKDSIHKKPLDDNDSIHKKPHDDNHSIHKKPQGDNESIHKKPLDDNHSIHKESQDDKDSIHKKPKDDKDSIHKKTQDDNDSINKKPHDDNHSVHKKPHDDNHSIHKESDVDNDSIGKSHGVHKQSFGKEPDVDNHSFGKESDVDDNSINKETDDDNRPMHEETDVDNNSINKETDDENRSIYEEPEVEISIHSKVNESGDSSQSKGSFVEKSSKNSSDTFEDVEDSFYSMGQESKDRIIGKKPEVVKNKKTKESKAKIKETKKSKVVKCKDYKEHERESKCFEDCSSSDGGYEDFCSSEFQQGDWAEFPHCLSSPSYHISKRYSCHKIRSPRCDQFGYDQCEPYNSLNRTVIIDFKPGYILSRFSECCRRLFSNVCRDSSSSDCSCMMYGSDYGSDCNVNTRGSRSPPRRYSGSRRRSETGIKPRCKCEEKTKKTKKKQSKSKPPSKKDKCPSKDVDPKTEKDIKCPPKSKEPKRKPSDTKKSKQPPPKSENQSQTPSKCENQSQTPSNCETLSKNSQTESESCQISPSSSEKIIIDIRSYVSDKLSERKEYKKNEYATKKKKESYDLKIQKCEKTVGFCEPRVDTSDEEKYLPPPEKKPLWNRHMPFRPVQRSDINNDLPSTASEQSLDIIQRSSTKENIKKPFQYLKNDQKCSADSYTCISNTNNRKKYDMETPSLIGWGNEQSPNETKEKSPMEYDVSKDSLIRSSDSSELLSLSKDLNKKPNGTSPIRLESQISDDSLLTTETEKSIKSKNPKKSFKIYTVDVKKLNKLREVENDGNVSTEDEMANDFAESFHSILSQMTHSNQSGLSSGRRKKYKVKVKPKKTKNNEKNRSTKSTTGLKHEKVFSCYDNDSRVPFFHKKVSDSDNDSGNGGQTMQEIKQSIRKNLDDLSTLISEQISPTMENLRKINCCAERSLLPFEEAASESEDYCFNLPKEVSEVLKLRNTKDSNKSERNSSCMQDPSLLREPSGVKEKAPNDSAKGEIDARGKKKVSKSTLELDIDNQASRQLPFYKDKSWYKSVPHFNENILDESSVNEEADEEADEEEYCQGPLDVKGLSSYALLSSLSSQKKSTFPYEDNASKLIQEQQGPKKNSNHNKKFITTAKSNIKDLPSQTQYHSEPEDQETTLTVLTPRDLRSQEDQETTLTVLTPRDLRSQEDRIIYSSSDSDFSDTSPRLSDTSTQTSLEKVFYGRGEGSKIK